MAGRRGERRATVDAGFLTYLLDALTPPGGVTARRMFGAFGLYRDGAFFGIVSAGRLYLKTAPADRAAFIAAGMGPFRPSERQTLHRYYEAPADVVEDPTLLRDWVERAVLAARAGDNPDRQNETDG